MEFEEFALLDRDGNPVGTARMSLRVEFDHDYDTKRFVPCRCYVELFGEGTPPARSWYRIDDIPGFAEIVTSAFAHAERVMNAQWTDDHEDTFGSSDPNREHRYP